MKIGSISYHDTSIFFIVGVALSFGTAHAQDQKSCHTTVECAQAAVTAAQQAQAMLKSIQDEMKNIKEVYISDAIEIPYNSADIRPVPNPSANNRYGENANIYHVSFPKEFRDVKVSLSISGFNIGHERNQTQNTVKITPININKNGFDVLVLSYNDEIVYEVNFTYTAVYSR